MEEKDLIQRSKEGDEEAFAALVRRYKTKVFNLAFSLTVDRDTADDLAQEAFIKAYFALPKFQFRSEFGTWLYRITVNHIRDYLRKKSRVSEISMEKIKEIPFSKEDEIEKREKMQTEEQKRKLLYQAIRTLPEKHQVILSLRDIQGLSYEEVAKVLEIPPGTVDSRLHRARKILRKKMNAFLNSERRAS